MAEGEERRAARQKEGLVSARIPRWDWAYTADTAVRSAKIIALLIWLILSGNQVENPSPAGWGFKWKWYTAVFLKDVKPLMNK